MCVCTIIVHHAFVVPMGAHLGGYLARFALPGTTPTYTLAGDSIRLVAGGNVVPVTWLDPAKGTEAVHGHEGARSIPLVHIAKPRADDRDKTGALVYAHGNAEDLGQVLAWAGRLAETYGRDVFVFDYEGYGLNHTRATEATIYANIASVVTYLHRVRGHRKLVLWGRSIGTAPAIYEAATATPGIVAAAVLQSPFRSVVTTYLPPRLVPRGCDILLNERVMATCTVPVFIVHGTEDAVVPFEHGVALARQPCVWGHCWLRGAGHNDIEMTPEYCDEMVRAVGHFLASVVPTASDTQLTQQWNWRAERRSLITGHLPSSGAVRRR